ncbi:hypothetical protein Ddc_23501 [Ditylenchus destructor]|nr:hypothetical protein Ddc_23501 [Ditylenchus destructor]
MWISVVLSKRLDVRAHPRLGDCYRHRPGPGVGRAARSRAARKAWLTWRCSRGIGLMGGAMLRGLRHRRPGVEVQATEARKAGMIGVIALLLGTILPFIVGASMAWAFGYRDAISMTTIGAGAVTYIVGPVTGAAIGATSDVMALSIATGLIKAILVMGENPGVAARWMGLDNPRSAMVFGGFPRDGEWGDGGPGGDGSAVGAVGGADGDIPHRAGFSRLGLRCCISSYGGWSANFGMCVVGSGVFARTRSHIWNAFQVWERACWGENGVQAVTCRLAYIRHSANNPANSDHAPWPQKHHANMLLNPIPGLQRYQFHAVLYTAAIRPGSSAYLPLS